MAYTINFDNRSSYKIMSKLIERYLGVEVRIEKSLSSNAFEYMLLVGLIKGFKGRKGKPVIELYYDDYFDTKISQYDIDAEHLTQFVKDTIQKFHEQYPEYFI